MDIWVIVLAITAWLVMAALSAVLATVALAMLWRNVKQMISRMIGALYMPMSMGSPRDWPRQEYSGPTITPPRPPMWPNHPYRKKREPIPQPPVAAPVAQTARPRPTLVPHAVDDDRAKTVAFSRYNSEDEVDTESDEGGARGIWDEDNSDGRSNISLEGDITPRPSGPRVTEPFRPPRGRRSLIHLFRKDKE